MNEHETISTSFNGAPNVCYPWWAHNILSAAALAGRVPVDRRLIVFLNELGSETLRLAGSESEEGGEVVAFATVCFRALFTGPDVTDSDDELDEWTAPVQAMLIMESLERRGYLHVAYGDSIPDPLNSDVPVRVIETRLESVWPAGAK